MKIATDNLYKQLRETTQTKHTLSSTRDITLPKLNIFHLYHPKIRSMFDVYHGLCTS